MKILVAIDGSGHSEAVLDEIARRHFPADSEVRVISVVESPYVPTTYPEAGIDMQLYDAMDRASHEAARTAVEKAAAKLQADERSRQL